MEQTALDRFTLVNLAAGYALGALGIPPPLAALLSIAYELAEPYTLPKLGGALPQSMLIVDTRANSLCDVAAVLIGANMGAKVRG